MSYNFYIILHLSSLLALALTLGALWGLYTQKNYQPKIRSLLLSLHGLIMFLILLAGFGLIAKINLSTPWPLWIYKKLILWTLLGAMPFVIKKSGEKFENSKKHFLVLIALFLLLFAGLLFVKLK